MRLRPLHDWVLIKRREPDERTPGGIIIPSSAKDKPSEGIVQAIGPGRYKTEKGKKEKKFIPTVLKPGERVLFVDYKARDIDFDGEDITLIREDDILGTYGGAGQAEKRVHRTETKEEQRPVVEDEVSLVKKRSPGKEVVSAPRTKPSKAMKTKKTAAARKPKKVLKKAVKMKVSAEKKKKPVPKKSKKTIIPKPPKKMLAKKEKAKRTTTATKASKKVAAKTVAKKILSKKVAPKKAVVKKTAPKKTGASKMAAKAVKKSVSKGKKRTGKR